jgi:hypothetical protein
LSLPSSANCAVFKLCCAAGLIVTVSGSKTLEVASRLDTGAEGDGLYGVVWGSVTGALMGNAIMRRVLLYRNAIIGLLYTGGNNSAR